MLRLEDLAAQAVSAAVLAVTLVLVLALVQFRLRAVRAHYLRRCPLPAINICESVPVEPTRPELPYFRMALLIELRPPNESAARLENAAKSMAWKRKKHGALNASGKRPAPGS